MHPCSWKISAYDDSSSANATCGRSHSRRDSSQQMGNGWLIWPTSSLKRDLLGQKAHPDSTLRSVKVLQPLLVPFLDTLGYLSHPSCRIKQTRTSQFFLSNSIHFPNVTFQYISSVLLCILYVAFRFGFKRTKHLKNNWLCEPTCGIQWKFPA